MKIAMVSEHASPLAALGGVDAGGQNVHVAALAGALADLGHQVVVHTRRDDPDLPPVVRLRDGVEVHHVDAGPPRAIPKDDIYGHVPAIADRLAERWRATPPDVVHTHFWMSGLAGVAAAERLRAGAAGSPGGRLPVVHTFHALGVVKRRHQGAADTSPPERSAEERRLLDRLDHVVATCSDEVFELRRLGARPDLLSVVPCGVDLDRFRPDGPAAPGGDRRRVLVVGRLVERKGVDTALEAVARLGDVEVVVAGGPEADRLPGDPEGCRLLALADRLRLGDRVSFLGRVRHDEVAPLIRSADVVACVPWYEPFGIVPLEAMACGRPVVASAVGGLIDTVVHGRTGLHVPPRDPDALARALRTVLDDRAVARAFGAAGRDRARRRYGWPTVAAGTAAVYRRLIAEHPLAEVAGR